MAHQIEISHPDKILFPELNWTKQKVVDFYLDLSDYLIPHLKNRPLVLKRFPDGIANKGFYQQKVPDYYPNWIDTYSVQRKEQGKQNMLEVHTKSVLKYVVNQDGICFHTWLSEYESIHNPNLMIFDLDPSGNDFSAVVQAAKILKAHIEKNGASPFVMTTGSSGLHVAIPIHPEEPFDKVREVAKTVAKSVAEQNPDLLTLEVRKDKRDGKIFVDYLRNSYGQTTICPYSLRAENHAPVATPLDWDELSEKELTSQFYHAKNIFKRLSRKSDPWKDISRYRCSLEIIRKEGA